MPRYIDAEKLAEHKFSYVTYDRYVSDGRRKSEEEVYAYKVGYNDAIDSIAQFAPTADVVERKNGKWIKNDGRYGWHCSECGVDDLYAYLRNAETGQDELQDRFCPNCGAEMCERREDE